MKKLFKAKHAPATEQAEGDLLAAISKIQEQLASLEKKVDSLIAQDSSRSVEAPFRNDFPKPHHFSSGPRYQERGRHEDRFREKEFTQVTCAECGQKCEVPFKPSEDRPVYCRECFAKRKGDRPFNEGRPFRDKHEKSFRGEERKPHREFEHKKKRFPRRSK